MTGAKRCSNVLFPTTLFLNSSSIFSIHQASSYGSDAFGSGIALHYVGILLLWHWCVSALPSKTYKPCGHKEVGNVTPFQKYWSLKTLWFSDSCFFVWTIISSLDRFTSLPLTYSEVFRVGVTNTVSWERGGSQCYCNLSHSFCSLLLAVSHAVGLRQLGEGLLLYEVVWERRCVCCGGWFFSVLYLCRGVAISWGFVCICLCRWMGVKCPIFAFPLHPCVHSFFFASHMHAAVPERCELSPLPAILGVRTASSSLLAGALASWATVFFLLIVVCTGISLSLG